LSLQREPQILSGFQVKLQGEFTQASLEYSSIIQAIICGLVLTSGAGTSVSGHKYLNNSLTYHLESLSNSHDDNSFGFTIIQPFHHQSGISATAVLKVIHIDNAFTSSLETSWWNLIHHLNGHLASLC
jgi:Na+/H+-translocating membrane pyrophosphatase